MSEDLVGKLLGGKYELRERIGRGGMAEVYKAYHAALDRYVALKILHPFLGEDPAFKGRFESEARNVARLRHPNIVQVYDFDQDPQRDVYYMVMEYIDGPTLRARLLSLEFQGERFTIPEAVQITRQLASALAYAHSRGMIHRDIKPGNIMFDSDGRVVLTDFGIARIISGPNMTASGSMVGTPIYMSPEQGLGQPGDHRSDIYSLGIVLYQLVTGRTPYDADTPIAIVLKHVNDPLPPPSALNPQIPEGLERILYRALAKSPAERYQSVEEMAIELDDLESSTTLILPIPARDAVTPGALLPGTTAGPAAEVLPGKLVSEVEEEVTEERPRRRGACLIWAILILVAALAASGGVYITFTGMLSSYLPFLPEAEVVLTDTPTPSLTPSPTPAPIITSTATPAVNIEATQISLTLQAIATLVATSPPTPADALTPDLTATILACAYNYEIVSQMPPNGAMYPELTTLNLSITLANRSQCPLPEGTRFTFTDGSRLSGPDYVEIDHALQPGEEVEILLNLRTSAYSAENPTVRSTWAVILPDGSQVGRPVTFVLRLFQSATPGG